MHNETRVQRVACKAVIESQGSILILKPSSIDANRNWHICGGIRDDISEPIIETGIREAYEETGTRLSGIPAKLVKVGEWPAVDKGEKVKILAVFYMFSLPVRPDIVLSDEHDDHAWINRSNYKEYPANAEVYELVEELL